MSYVPKSFDEPGTREELVARVRDRYEMARQHKYAGITVSLVEAEALLERDGPGT